jgi:hypothetical protein
MNPSFFFARVVIGGCRAAQGRYIEAIREFRLAEAEGGRVVLLARLGYALAPAGRRAGAESILAEYPASLAVADWVNVATAMVQVGLGDRAGALQSLEAGFAKHETDVNYIHAEPIFDPLRGETRFRALERRLELCGWRQPGRALRAGLRKTKERRPKAPLLNLQIADSSYARLRSRISARPARPVPSIA